MISLIDPLTKCWMADDALLSYSDSIVLVVYLILRHEIPRMSCMSTPLFDTGLKGLEVPDPTQSDIGSNNQPYEDY